MKNTYDLAGTNDFVCASDCNQCDADACWIGKEVKPGPSAAVDTISPCPLPERSPDFTPDFTPGYFIY